MSSSSSNDRRALDDLITTTLDLLGKMSGFIGSQNRETVWITSAIAQRGSAQANIEGSIKIGMKKYWRGIASSTRFPGFKLEKCLNTLQIDIVISWNFSDPNKLLRSTAFVEKMRTITQVVVPKEDEAKDWLYVWNGLKRRWGSRNYCCCDPSNGVPDRLQPRFTREPPETLRLFMGYIVDLTLVVDQLFVIVLALGPPNLLTQTDIDATLDKYTSSAADTVHAKIREYCNEATFAKICRSNKAEEKITELIDIHRVKREGPES
ncbi:hypothetical protein B0H14DRAFT_3455868 [Mycena olivaceomarginata]|nr:hypothetical protein B0H14DRAFT_3455868 [Mycena olivaceomarginata]